MKHRGHLSEKERKARSALAKLVHDRPFVCGSLVTLSRLCGKPGCKCTKGERHVSLALSVRMKGGRKMIHVPRKFEKEIEHMVAGYREIKSLLDLASQEALERFLEKKAEAEGTARP